MALEINFNNFHHVIIIMERHDDSKYWDSETCMDTRNGGI